MFITYISQLKLLISDSFLDISALQFFHYRNVNRFSVVEFIFFISDDSWIHLIFKYQFDYKQVFKIGVILKNLCRLCDAFQRKLTHLVLL